MFSDNKNLLQIFGKKSHTLPWVFNLCESLVSSDVFPSKCYIAKITLTIKNCSEYASNVVKCINDDNFIPFFHDVNFPKRHYNKAWGGGGRSGFRVNEMQLTFLPSDQKNRSFQFKNIFYFECFLNVKQQKVLVKVFFSKCLIIRVT